MTSDPAALQSSPELTESPIATTHQDPFEAAFPIVGVAASAGGLEAFTQLLSHLPTDTGMAFVLIQHLSPDHESLLTEILARVTPLPVRDVQNGMASRAKPRVCDSPQHQNDFGARPIAAVAP